MTDNTHTTTLTLEKATKTTYRYAEDADGEPPIIGNLYVKKWVYGEEPPERIEAEVRPA